MRPTFSAKLSIIAAILLLLVIGGGAYWLYSNGNFSHEQNTESSEIAIKYELQTHEYYPLDKLNHRQFHIESESDLEAFYSLFSDKLEVNPEYLKGNDIFIKVAPASSGSIKHTLKDVNFDNNTVNFIISTESPEVGTDDMAFWYFVAVIPRDKLKNIDTSDWIKPSTIDNKKWSR